VGIRPGEKLHEVLCPQDAAHLTLEFDDHYLIEPTINFARAVRYDRNPLGESGRRVPQAFEYSSRANGQFLEVAVLRALLQRVAP
jgi:UDP-N-acetylglucosamine 4,6-dehydratase